MRRSLLSTAVLALAIVCVQQALRAPVASAGGGAALPERLSETGIERGRPFSPQYPLWSDGAVKSRWVYLPPGTTIDARSTAWDFPAGTKFWKEFRFNGRKVETRMLWKASDSHWEFGSYVWDADGSDATLAPADGVVGAADLGGGKRHSIPSRIDCRSCHEARRIEVLGFNALQLSTDRDPNAIHGEPIAAGDVTLKTLVEEKLLSPARTDLLAAPPRISGDPLTRSVVGYLAANCGHCHNRDTDVPLLGASLRPGDVADGGAIARALASHRTDWQVPGTGEAPSLAINPASPDASAILVRMRSRRPSSQMPPTGTAIVDTEAVAAVRAWIGTVDRRP